MQNVLVKPNVIDYDEIDSFLKGGRQPKINTDPIEWVKGEPTVDLCISHNLPQSLFKLEEKSFDNISVCISDYSCGKRWFNPYSFVLIT